MLIIMRVTAQLAERLFKEKKLEFETANNIVSGYNLGELRVASGDIQYSVVR